MPQSDYRDYTESGVKIAASGRELRIALTSLAEGAVRGQMVDLNGKPVPGFSLWLTSLQAMAHGSKQVEGDSEGRFEIAGIPTGHQQFATLAIPNIRVSGITVNDTSDPPLRLTLDVGEYMLEGQVRDSYSNAVAGAEVSLTWSYESNGIASHAARDTTTDSGGHFRFSQLGPGAHTLEVNASGYQQQRIEQDVGVRATVQIELRALAR